MSTNAKGDATTTELSRAAQVLARRVAESRATIPVFELGAPVEGLDGDGAVDRVIAACGQALRAHPLANAAYRDARLECYERINVAIAVHAGDTLLTPVIVDADTKSAAEIGAEREQLTAAAHAGELTGAQLSGATFTVQALDVPRFAPVVVPGQAAALGIGTSELTLACDHRILFGETAAGFLRAICAAL